MQKGTVTIVGHPNVGKSTLFNRIIKKNISIVENTPGITRDRIYYFSEWLTKEFLIIDTGGITSNKKIIFSQEIKIQAEIAIKESNVIIFILSYKEGITSDDEMITKILYRTKKPIILVVNKYDKQDKDNDLYKYMKLGFGEPIAISAAHGIGISTLLDKLVFYLNNIAITKKIKGINFSLIGKQNVGKSSLINTILNEKRVIVSPIAGTTTDSIYISFKRNNQNYTIIDTAGIRQKNKIYKKIEKYSIIRTINTIKQSDIVLLIIDGTIPITNQDTNIAGIIFEQNKPIILVINKCEFLIKKNKQLIKKKEQIIREYFKYLSYAKMIFISALEKKNINILFKTINKIYIGLTQRIKTSILNEILVKIQLLNPPPNFNGGRLKIYYSTQPKNIIPTFIMFCNNQKYIHFSYKRFLENQLREYFGFEGIPIKILFRERK